MCSIRISVFSLWLNDKASLNYLNWTVIVNVISDTCASLDKGLKISAIRSFIVTEIEHLSTRCMVTWHIYLITCSSFLIIHTCFSLSHQSINVPAAFLLPTFELELDPFSACCCLSLFRLSDSVFKPLLLWARASFSILKSHPAFLGGLHLAVKPVLKCRPP